jgi:hypothetical protein
MTNYFTDYDALTEEQSMTSHLLPKGEYVSWIREVETKKGSQAHTKDKTYVVLTVDVYDSDEKPHTITCWCALPHLLRHLCEAVGHLYEYENKTLILNDHLLRKEVIAVVDIQKAKDGYKAKNVIQDFKKKEGLPQKPFDDEISF